MKWMLVLLCLLLPGVANAQIAPNRGPVAGLATTFANIDPKTGKVEEMAGDVFHCLSREVDNTTFGVAHRTLPCGTIVLIVNIRNGRTVRAPVIDRGPYRAVPRSCSKARAGRYPSQKCWKMGKTIVSAVLKESNPWAFGNIVDLTPPVARKLRLRGKEPVLLFVPSKERYSW